MTSIRSKAILADLRAGVETYKQIADRHGVAPQWVGYLAVKNGINGIQRWAIRTAELNAAKRTPSEKAEK